MALLVSIDHHPPVVGGREKVWSWRNLLNEIVSKLIFKKKNKKMRSWKVKKKVKKKNFVKT